MRVLKVLSGLIGVLFIAYLAIAVYLPATVQVEFTQKVYALPKAVFYQLTCLEHWESWNAQRDLAPSTEFIYNDTFCGVGASCSWNSKTFGSGFWRIDSIEHNAYLRLENSNSEIGEGRTEVELVEDGITCNVVWRYQSKEIPLFKRPIVFLSKGALENTHRLSLTNLKRESELNLMKELREFEYLFNIVLKEIDEFTLVEIKDSVTIDGFNSFLVSTLEQLNDLDQELYLQLSDATYGIVYGVGNSKSLLSIAKPFSGNFKPNKQVSTIRFPRQRAATATVKENDDVNKAYSALSDFLSDKGLEIKYPFFQEIEIDSVNDSFSYSTVKIIYPIKPKNKTE